MDRTDVFTIDYLRNSRAEGLFRGEGVRKVLDFGGVRDGETVVDFGTGLGYFLSLIEREVENARLIGIDVRESLIREAEKTVKPTKPGNTMEFLVADARATNLPAESADVAVCCALLVHPSRPEEIVREMIRVTKIGGRVIAVEPIPTNLVPELWHDVDAERRAREMAEHRRLVEETAEPDSDYEIALKLPTVFGRHGLANVEADAVPALRQYGCGFEKYTISLWILAKGERVHTSP